MLTQVALGNLTLSVDFTTSGSTYSVIDSAVQIGFTPVGSEAYTH